MTLSRKIFENTADVDNAEKVLVEMGFTVIQRINDIRNHAVILLYVTEKLSREVKI